MEAASIERTRRLFTLMIDQVRQAWLLALREIVQAFTESDTLT